MCSWNLASGTFSQCYFIRAYFSTKLLAVILFGRKIQIFLLSPRVFLLTIPVC